MPGCVRIYGFIHMTIHTEVFITTLKALSSDLRWCSCKNFSTQYHTVDVITHDESTTVFSWEVKSLEEYCILNALIWTEDHGKVYIPDLIAEYGGDITLIIHQGKKAEDFFLNDGTIPDPISTDNAEFKIVQTIIKLQLEGGEIDKWNKISNTCMSISEETSAGVHRLYTMQKTCTNHQK